MAQKTYARSLRTVNQCASNFSFYSETDYASLWKKTTQLSGEFVGFCEKSLWYYRKNRGMKKNRNKRYKYKTFYKTGFCVSALNNAYTFSPILLKFHKQSFYSKYNPIKAIHKVGRPAFLGKKPEQRKGRISFGQKKG